MIQIQLGRFGDIVNVIPVAYSLSRKIGRVNWLVGKEFEGLLEGCSYINAVRWNGGPETLRDAIRNYQSGNPIVTQVFCNPDERRMTSSYALEQWRLAGVAESFGSVPLLFDQPNEARANMLRDRALSRRHSGRPLIVACVDGISSPFPQGPRLLAMLRGLDADVVDLRDVKAERVFDLLPLFNAADCLASVDTLPLHLARAATCPTVCLLNDQWDGWRASVPPPQCVAHRTYSEASKDLPAVVAMVEEISSRPACRSAVVVCNLFDTTSDRGRRARATWPDGWLSPKPKRSAKDIGDARALPFMRDILAAGLESDADIVCWLNDDTALTPGALDKIKAHCARWDFGCVRRDPAHIGRESFFFRADWLRANLDKMPDVILAAPQPDLVLAKWLRSLRGIKTTLENLAFDFPPVDLPPGLVHHEAHTSSWLPHQDSASARWNERLFSQVDS